MASKIKKMAHRFLAHLEEKGYDNAHTVLATILFEFRECLIFVFRFLLAYKPHFNFYGLNPKKLSAEQKDHDPVILIHSNYTNQSTWLSLASTLSKKYKGPVFTVNITAGDLSQKDIDIIETKITDIKNLYNFDDPNDVVTHFVGHSKGAWLAEYMSMNQSDWSLRDGQLYRVKDELLTYRPDVGTVIMIASGNKPVHYDSVTEVANKFRYIHGTQDLLWQKRLELREEHIIDVECGHFALLNRPETHEAICQWLNEAESEEEEENSFSSSALSS